ncbi:putative ribonuclease h protein at1g65750 [Phtheirospermum japonicum]|uniref:Putative ribonuclease h protein at1g65750 n=1 Tax=Phtheirospermum japonicum TaxID=374723 RepID=A0A830CNZ3_9LAMI|nr:putative ribonuclease h protein at1g65750 [Phtheirospermum japonicum]
MEPLRVIPERRRQGALHGTTLADQFLPITNSWGSRLAFTPNSMLFGEHLIFVMTGILIEFGSK